MGSSLRDDDLIFELPEQVKNQIAAGEVVERPASVVKELTENALDAGATEIRVDLEEGGVRLIRITDDGSGMGRGDLGRAFVPHATSKLRTVEDLEHIASLGFRGEALASIGSVARVKVLSRRPSDGTGARLENEGGELGPVLEAGGPVGTTVEVRDLFYNTPARRRFLKTTRTELSRCLDVLQRLAMAHVGVGFVVTHDRAKVFDVEASMDLRERVRRLFGAELADALVGVDASDGSTRITGLLAPPRFARGDTSRQMWFLNGRPLRDKILIRVLRQAYHGFQVEHRQPVAFLSLSMDPALVDCNVHPMKTEVRFREERRMFGFLHKALRDAVARTDMATPGERMIERLERREDRALRQGHLPDPGVLQPRPTASGASSTEPARVYEVPGRPFDASQITGAGPGAPASSSPAPAPSGWEARDDYRGPYLKVDRTYILRALPEGFEIVDQHALHERVTFEALKDQLREGGIEVQRQLVPELVEVSRDEAHLLAEHVEAMAAIGVDLAIFGPTTVAIHGLPALMRSPKAEEIVREVLGLLRRGGKPPGPEEFLDEVLHSMACRSSVMAGDDLSDAEIQTLLQRAGALEHSQTCPHGRPTRVRFKGSDLEKAFGRK